jgi:hypothetical protein
MKKNGLVVSLFVLFILCLACSQSVLKSATLQKEVVFEYATFESHPVEIVYDHDNGRVTLRIRFNGDEYYSTVNSDYWLALLKEEVLRLTSTNQPVKLGKSGYIFKFLGGHPVWAPYLTHYVDYNYRCLYFAGNGSINGKTIQAQGDEEIKGWNGYELWRPK